MNLAKPDTLEIPSKLASKLRSAGSIRGHWADARQAFADWDRSDEGFAAIDSSLTAFFSNADNPRKLDVLKGVDEEVRDLKNQLLNDLRNDHVYVFLRGLLKTITEPSKIVARATRFATQSSLGNAYGSPVF